MMTKLVLKKATTYLGKICFNTHGSFRMSKIRLVYLLVGRMGIVPINLFTAVKKEFYKCNWMR